MKKINIKKFIKDAKKVRQTFIDEAKGCTCNCHSNAWDMPDRCSSCGHIPIYFKTVHTVSERTAKHTKHAFDSHGICWCGETEDTREYIFLRATPHDLSHPKTEDTITKWDHPTCRCICHIDSTEPDYESETCVHCKTEDTGECSCHCHCEEIYCKHIQLVKYSCLHCSPEVKTQQRWEETFDEEFTFIEYMAGQVLKKEIWESTKGLNRLKQFISQEIETAKKEAEANYEAIIEVKKLRIKERLIEKIITWSRGHHTGDIDELYEVNLSDLLRFLEELK